MVRLASRASPSVRNVSVAWRPRLRHTITYGQSQRPRHSHVLLWRRKTPGVLVRSSFAAIGPPGRRSCAGSGDPCERGRTVPSIEPSAVLKGYGRVAPPPSTQASSSSGGTVGGTRRDDGESPGGDERVDPRRWAGEVGRGLPHPEPRLRVNGRLGPQHRSSAFGDRFDHLGGQADAQRSATGRNWERLWRCFPASVRAAHAPMMGAMRTETSHAQAFGPASLTRARRAINDERPSMSRCRQAGSSATRARARNSSAGSRRQRG